MPLYDFYCDGCQRTDEYYVPSPQDALGWTAAQAAAETDCKTCSKRTLTWSGLARFSHQAPLPTGAYDKQGKFYRGDFGGGQRALPRKHVIRRF